jgi:hypothetical protein
MPAPRPLPAPQVSLVLEYCELGSLRDALDSGAFVSGEAARARRAPRRRARTGLVGWLHPHKAGRMASRPQSWSSSCRGTCLRGPRADSPFAPRRRRPFARRPLHTPPPSHAAPSHAAPFTRRPFARPDSGGVNYPAVLDTAVDVARAMVHLHRQSVLHSDLKVRRAGGGGGGGWGPGAA